MSTVPSFWKEFKHSRSGMAGLTILIFLILMSVLALVTIPIDTFKQWHNPNQWIQLPKGAAPIWTNFFSEVKQPEHLIFDKPRVEERDFGSISVVSHIYTFDFQFDGFPNDFMLDYDVSYVGNPPFLEFSVLRPDGEKVELSSITLPPKPPRIIRYLYNGTLFSTDRNLRLSTAQFLDSVLERSIRIDEVSPQVSILAVKEDGMIKAQTANVLKGTYLFNATFFLFDKEDQLESTVLIIGGKVFGLLGTDDLRRDLFLGVIWGTPIALAIGLSVATLAVGIGIVYGVVSGYHGKRTDEIMMRANDLVYALPALPFLIILTISVGNSIIFVIFYLVIFGWVGIAKVSRSMTLQLKNTGYVEAAELIGASRWRIIFKHIIPQTAPYALASIALSVPAAILTEAGLSFLGLGDPTLPTWGQLLHDAHQFGAAARGMWWWILPPGFMIASTGLAFVLIGTAVESIINPKMKR